MKARTESEVKAYADGYKACYKEFCQCLKNNTAEQAIKKMGVFVVVVNNCVEVAEQNVRILTLLWILSITAN